MVKRSSLTLREVNAAAAKVQAGARHRLARLALGRARVREIELRRIERLAILKYLRKVRYLAFYALRSSAVRGLAACRARAVALEAVRHALRCAENAKQSEVTAFDGLEKLHRREESAEWMRRYIKERAAEPIPPQVRDVLARRLEQANKTEEDKLRIRAQLAQFDVRCERCGTVGLFAGNCSKCRDENAILNTGALLFEEKSDGVHTEEEDDESLFIDKERREHNVQKLIDLLREDLKKPLLILEKPYLEGCKRSYSALAEATLASSVLEATRSGASKKPYEAKTAAEANLHLVLHYAWDTLKKYVPGNGIADFSASILQHPHRRSLGKPTKAIREVEDREYFKAQTNKKERQYQHAHEHRGYLRFADGDVENLDDVWKRGVAYCFDRSFSQGKEREAELARNYNADPYACKRNNHSHKNWLDITSTHDRHATTGRHLANKTRKLEKDMRTQSAWCGAQAKAMAQYGDMCTHIVSMLAREVEAEGRRESLAVHGLARLDPKQQKLETAKLEEARAEAADKIMRVLFEYGLITPMQEAEYLMYANRLTADIIDPDGAISADANNFSKSAASSKFADIFGFAAVNKVLYTQGSSSQLLTQEKKRTDAHNPLASDALSLNIDDMFITPPQKQPLANQEVQTKNDYFEKKKQLTCLAAHGKQHVRRGVFGDDSTITPASVPLPEALSSGGFAAPRALTNEEQRYRQLWTERCTPTATLEKSKYAADTLEEKRQFYRASKRKTTLPFWSRVSDRGSLPGQRQYSVVFGQPMDTFFMPGTLPTKKGATKKLIAAGASSLKQQGHSGHGSLVDSHRREESRSNDSNIDENYANTVYTTRSNLVY